MIGLEIKCRPVISALKGQDRFYFEKGTSIEKCESQLDTFEEAPSPRTEAATMA